MTADRDVDRRKNRGLSDEEIDTIKEQLLASIYEDIGRSVVSKILWVAGTLLAAGLAYLAATGKLK